MTAFIVRHVRRIRQDMWRRRADRAWHDINGW